MTDPIKPEKPPVPLTGWPGAVAALGGLAIICATIVAITWLLVGR